ncbi:hypothetical protein GCM10007935_10830 [Hydrogenophaga electricum]|uniref:Uncharacterized protein n=1 Tax=Hydrogenophaga electricum TaxID=1230953 RepID=A0ABQ6BZU2_9BURK|nr:hypothetical protein GCM10007935_10830 [Hydrogenophaga electricum]
MSCQCFLDYIEKDGACQPPPQCRVGYVYSELMGVCIPVDYGPGDPQDPNCPTGQVKVGNECVVPYDPPTQCPSGQTLTNGVCKCPEGQVLKDGQCKPPECPAPLGSTVAGEGQYQGGAGYTGGLLCFNSCKVYPSFSGKDPTSGKWFASGPLISTGVSCVGSPSGGPGSPPTSNNSPPDDPPLKDDVPRTCKTGLCPGTVNGQHVCLKCSESKTNTSNNSNNTTTTKDGEGNTTGSETGSSNSTSSTTCKDGKCTTTTETTTSSGNGGGSTTKTETKEESKDDFCKQNPTSAHCVDSSFGGDCSGSFQCTGDAVQCATARAANEQLCALKVDPANSVLGVGQAALGGGNGTDHPRSNAEFKDVGVLDQTNPFGGGCPSDIGIPVLGKTIVIPLSQLCTALSAMGAIAVAFSLLAAAFIVVKV